MSGDSHVTQTVEELTWFSELVRHGISTNLSETFSVALYPRLVSLSQIKVGRSLTVSAQESKLAISEVPKA